MKNLTRIFAVVALICALLCMTACGEPASTQGTPAGSTAPAQTEATLPEGVSYAITVVDAEGNPVVGAMVAICQNVEGGMCYMPGMTGEDGVALFYEAAIPVQNNMKVRVLAADGYDLPLDETGDIRYTIIPDGTVQMSLVLEKLAN